MNSLIIKLAHKFYEKNGFLRVTKSDLPDNFPIMLSDNIFYCLTVPITSFPAEDY